METNKILGDNAIAKTQWVQLGDIVTRLQNSRNVQRHEALRLLQLRGLQLLRPAILCIGYESTVLTAEVESAYSQKCSEKILTPHKDWHSGDADDPTLATMAFHIPALLNWLKLTNLNIDTTEWDLWKRKTLPEIQSRKLLFADITRKTKLDSQRAAARMHSRFIRLRYAPDYLGMNRNSFNKDVRPFITEISTAGVRGVSYDRIDLDKWADKHKQQNSRPGDNDELCQIQPQASTRKRKVKYGTSINISVDDEFTEALKRVKNRKQSAS